MTTNNTLNTWPGLTSVCDTIDRLYLNLMALDLDAIDGNPPPPEEAHPVLTLIDTWRTQMQALDHDTMQLAGQYTDQVQAMTAARIERYRDEPDLRPLIRLGLQTVMASRT